MATTHYSHLGITAPLTGSGYIKYNVRHADEVEARYLVAHKVDATSDDPEGSAAVEEWTADHCRTALGYSEGSILVGIASAKVTLWRRG